MEEIREVIYIRIFAGIHALITLRVLFLKVRECTNWVAYNVKKNVRLRNWHIDRQLTENRVTWGMTNKIYFVEKRF